MRPIGIGLGVGFIAGAAAGVTPVAAWDASTSTLAQLTVLASVSRTSLATMFDSTGKLTYAPNNLLTQSNTFSNAVWAKTTMTVTSGATDPFGTSFAWTLTATAPGALLYQLQSLAGPNAIPYVWMRRKTGSGIIYLRNANNVSIDVTGQVSSSWALVYVAPTAALGSNLFLISLATSGDEIEIYSAGYSAVTYETTPRAQDKISTGASAYYGPRIDYDPNTLAVKGLLIEEARTNIFIQSGGLSATSTVNAIKSTDGTLAPDGVTAMTKLTATASAGAHEIYNTGAVSVSSGGTYTSSIFVKKGNHRYVFINAEIYAAVGFVAVFDLDNPAAATQTWSVGTGAYSSSRIDAVGGGIYRIQVTGAIGSGTTGYFVAGFVAAATGNSTASVEPSWTAAGAEYGYFFGGQLEAGSFATSYIPTAASSVTRAADVVQFTGPALTALQGSAGSAITETISLSGTSPASITNLIRGTNSILYRDTTGKTGTTNGTTALLTAAAPTWNAALRNGLAWSGAGRSLVFTGGAVATDANAVSNGGTLYLGSNNGSAVENGWYQSFAIYNQRLSDATLQAKSVVGASY